MGYLFSLTEYKRKPPPQPKLLSAQSLNHYDTETDNLLRNIYFLKNWPIDILSENPRQCLVHYFNRGQILVRDSKASDWIYIVKSGSLSVMKKLKRAEPESDERILRKISSIDENDNKEPKSLAELDLMLEKSVPGIYNKADRLGLLDYDDLVTQKRDKFKISIQNPEIQMLYNENKAPSNSELTGKKAMLPMLTKTKKAVYFSTSNTDILENTKPRVRKVSKIKPLKEEKARAALFGTTKRCELAENLDRKSSDENRSDVEKDPTFVLVQILDRGHYFGLANMFFDEQPSLSVISNGAECILLSKKFFLEHAPPHLVDDIRKMEIPFQTDKEMQTNLQNYVNWVSHRSKSYRSIADIIRMREIKNKQYPLYYPKDYSFRTGPRK